MLDKKSRWLPKLGDPFEGQGFLHLQPFIPHLNFSDNVLFIGQFELVRMAGQLNENTQTTHQCPVTIRYGTIDIATEKITEQVFFS